MKTRRIVDNKGRQEIMRLPEDGQKTTDDGGAGLDPLAFEASILWLRDVSRFPYVRVFMARGCKSRRGKLDTGQGHVVGYAKLRLDTPVQGKPARYNRRVFYLRDADLKAFELGEVRMTGGEIEPASILPGVAGKPVNSKPVNGTALGAGRQGKSLDEGDVLQWLDDEAKSLPRANGADRADSKPGPAETTARPPTGRVMGTLSPLDGGQPVVLNKERMTVGRLDECDISLEHSNVSGLHCELYIVQGYWFVKDQNSTNGVRVNGTRIAAQSQKRLDPGVEVAFASHRFKIQYIPEDLGAVGPPPEDDDSASVMAESLLRKSSGLWPQQKY